MKTKILLIIGLFIGSIINAQDSLNTQLNKPRLIGFSPSKKTKNVNGMLIKYYDEVDNEIRPKKVNGVGLGFNGLGIFFPALLLVSIPSINNWAINDIASEPLPEKMNKINGMQLSIINMEPTVTNGLEINVSSNISAPSVTNGVALSPLYNFHHTTKGVAVSTFANVAQKCRGAQVGLFNVCQDSRGIQIGFWNKNEKRSFPLINWNFKAKKS
ncbi:hypothetical protein ACM46_07050 [Chryseobacterium angstadtii]|uniref:Uncharacterized protein n=1 Tax=Chryseobacterium angstadtii TaxID=558151 RepID=A0A0J7IHS9_9FLAO|nr:hypothetical protein [Chryseobacterium angstadtii]KMQ65627.1 hypothetical protein ACM46_07050 [Chryseobacterium angstadtii]